MLGSEIVKTLTRSDKLTMSKLIAWGQEELDITQQDQVIKKISELKPDIVINATGYTNVDGAEKESKLAFKVNADGVGYIAQACNQIGASLIHFSTDYVFDGSQPGGYLESDKEHIGSVNEYGESKLSGELRIKNYALRKYFIVRTSWLYGIGGKNFVETMLSRAKADQKEFKVINDQFGRPTWTGDLAERVIWMIERMDELKGGVYHVTNYISEKRKAKSEKLQLKAKSFLDQENIEGIAWYQFAKEIFKQAKEIGILLKMPKVEPCTTDQFPGPAKRPRYSVLLNTKLPEMREWKEGLREYLSSKFKVQN